MNVLRRSRTC